ncbi:bifunctional glycosyltransferase family 2/GtrA family protein [Pseudidiomarina andamanensis]|uniref:Glycosyltransferase n=1 Tax=Pseudidiomarina andamanensis TaxID=1940690 RepID=A0AA92EUG6_9GAMM|nr:bifunctional glycosyltransferase family 2/GtrA family protein [Pseudidiomarina andamanensis]MDS0219001.1 bifunctional glycosyltransferase family 2/GtrA family protein [Pseudidiomarina andamanensis]QGT96356.1 glycosyltransferase [Pseudidiomarina andamanensis]
MPKPVIVIPAYNPDGELLQLIESLQQSRQHYDSIVIINDGSATDEVFSRLPKVSYLHVITHDENRGKGAALKTGFQWILDNRPNSLGAITADADGQHLPKDIIRVLEEFAQHPEELWLGSRNFKRQGIPFRSWLGNTFARYTFRLGLRINIPDTQTGLRGIPIQLLNALVRTPSDRYEFELDMLILAKQEDVPFRSVAITTVYEHGNASSHFRPLQDSAIIYKKFLKFAGVGMASAGLDYGLFALVYGFTGEILLAIASARFVSGIFNFTLNRQWVFGKGSSLARDAAKYTTLAIVLVLANYLLTKSFYAIGLSPFIGKPIAEVTVFLLSYGFQKKLVFKRKV